MRMLLYGFGSYKQFRENITATILKGLPRRAGLTKVVFPVRFHRGQFIGALKRHKPDVVLGLGQSSRQRIEMEARAANRRRASKQDSPKAIRPNGPRWLATTLGIKLGRQARRSKNAGDYVCNYSMYVMLDHIKRSGLTVHFGFVHIPYNYEVGKAKRCVRAILKSLTSASTASPG